ncbi:hypothetical protein [Okeania sp. SIO2C9]|uniref:hypothetical protein n=1 Tax=Okeania sp. SIO2C9 TaxID=2607791 RepID=UPI0025EBDA30|nr:hypothetical protein [Okeania sp. SIO2C9]
MHERDVNAAINILETVQPKTKVETKATENPIQLSIFDEVAEGHWSIIYRTGRKCQTGKPAFSSDVSTRSESFVQLSLFE